MPTLAAAGAASGIGLAGAVALHRASLAPPVAATLLAAASLATWISTLGFALTLATAGWSIIRGNHTLARWTGWSALAIAAAFAARLPFTRTGTGHLPAIADLWIIATVIAVIRRRTAATAPQKLRNPQPWLSRNAAPPRAGSVPARPGRGAPRRPRTVNPARPDIPAIAGSPWRVIGRI